MRRAVTVVAATTALVLSVACSGRTGGAAVTPSARPATAAPPPADWLTYHFNGTRTGDYPSMPAPRGTPRVILRLRLDGPVYASPIVARGITVVATENDTVYAFDGDYRLLWRRHLGPPSPQSERPCGDIDPLGITGTPVYSLSTGLVYVAPEFSGRPPTHQLYGLNLRNGAVAFHRSLDLPGVDRGAMQQRGALALSHGSTQVYVPFGGLAGDCALYKGRVVGYSPRGTGNPISFTVPTAREAGIWSAPGPSVDPVSTNRIYVSVGNGAAGVGDPYDHSDSVLALSAGLRLLDSFSPTSWASDNDNDADLGSQGPALVGPWVFIAGKSGTAYVLRGAHLGGIGGQVSRLSLCQSFGGTAWHADTVYVPCTDGVRAVRIDSTGHLHALWHATGAAAGSPVLGGGRVWTLDTGGGVLYSLATGTGQTLTQVDVGATSRFATPALRGRDVLVPTLTGLTVVRTS